jgi:4-hydroxyacetophenone monooxygenase
MVDDSSIRILRNLSLYEIQRQRLWGNGQQMIRSMSERPAVDDAALREALASADLRVLLMVLFQTTGDEHWLSFRPKRDVQLIADEDAGLTAAEQNEIRVAAHGLLSRGDDLRPAIANPDAALMKRMMEVCLGEDVPPEYAPMMREELGFESRDVAWSGDPGTQLEPVLIVGAGVSGIGLGARLGRLGIPYLICERNGDVGGVWLENRYPGAGVDTPNHSYSYSFGRPFAWSRYFSTRDEVLAYLRQCADEFEVRANIRFHTSVESARWDAESRRWIVGVRGPDGCEELAVPMLVSAIGQFGKPAMPAIPGAEDFEGAAFHSAEWPQGLSCEGKKVAVIGNGASAMQIVPSIVDQVESLTVYQRTAQWVRPITRYRDAIGPAQWLLDHVPLYAAWFRFTMWWRYGDGLLPLLRKDPAWPHPERAVNERNDRHRVEMIGHIESELGDRQDLIAKSTPDYPPFGKRILLDNGWYQAIKSPRVELVTAPVEAITSGGIRSGDGEERAADVIVYATGFDMTTMAGRLNIRGTDGVVLADAWNDDPRAYLGIAVPGFPNFFMMGGPNTGLGHGGSTIFQAESQARYISAMIVRMIENDICVVAVRQEPFEAFVNTVDRAHDELIWTHPSVRTYYRNAQGRVVSVMPFRLVDYWQMTREPDLSHYRIERQKRDKDQSGAFRSDAQCR